MLLTAVVITASNRASKGIYEDSSGQILSQGLQKLGYNVMGTEIVEDNVEQIQSALKNALASKVNLIVTTGGTGISPTDVTPEATLPLIEKLLPGVSEALRAHSREKVPTADLSRGVAGVTQNSFIVNLPGSPGGVRDGLVIIERLASHVHEQLAGKDH